MPALNSNKRKTRILSKNRKHTHDTLGRKNRFVVGKIVHY